MDKKIKKVWVKALKSGEYTQASGSLKDGDWFCCLGVLCDIQGYNWERRIKDFQSDELPKGYNAGVPRKVAEDLAIMNDEGENFETIADWIEENL